MFHLKDTKEIRTIVQRWKDLKQKKYVETMKKELKIETPKPLSKQKHESLYLIVDPKGNCRMYDGQACQ